jgi:sugar phosphate isomerase/epimerase
VTIQPVEIESGLAVRKLPFGLVSLDFHDLNDLYATASARGIGWVEIYLDVSADETDIDRILHERDERGILVTSLATMAKLSQVSDDEVAEHVRLIYRSIDMAAAVGSPHATFMYGSNGDLNPAAARERFLGRVAPLAEYAAGKGVTLLVENVFSRGAPGDLDSIESTLALFSALDAENVGLNFDPANFAIAGEDASAHAYRELRHLIRYMHLKDVRPQAEVDEPLGDRKVLEDYVRGPFVVVPLGEGCVDVAGLVDAIVEDARGFVVALEPTAKGAANAAWLDASIAFLASHRIENDAKAAAE